MVTIKKLEMTNVLLMVHMTADMITAFLRLHSLCIPQVVGGGGGQMILRGNLNFFGKEQGGMSRFFITGTGGGGCQLFSI